MREHDRRGHQLWRLIAGVAEHQALVARALFVGVLAFVRVVVDALGDVVGLLAERAEDLAGIRLEHAILVRVADLTDGGTGLREVVELGAGRDLTGEDDDVALGEGFTGHAAFGVLRKAGVEDAVADRVAHLVGVAFGDGFAGEEIVACHRRVSSFEG